MGAIFNAVASLFGYLLNAIYMIVNNYGIAIILFTIVTKIILLPLSYKQQKSAILAQKMQPLLMDLQNKYKNNPERLNEEYMKLTKEYKYNPFGGCLMSLVQIPIILGMLFLVGKPLTYMLKLDKPTVDAYIEELNVGKTEEEIAQENNNRSYPEIEVIKNKELLNMDFLGINLGDIPSHHMGQLELAIIPILSAVLTYLSVYFMNGVPDKKKEEEATSTSLTKTDEVPMPNMKMFNMMLPIMSGIIAYIVPLGLGLYWLTSSLIQIIQQILIKKFMGKGKEIKL